MHLDDLDRAQAVEDFLDEDELEEVRKSGLQVSSDYDTFGSTAADRALWAAQAVASGQDRDHVSFVPKDIVVPVPDSMGAAYTPPTFCGHVRSCHMTVCQCHLLL